MEYILVLCTIDNFDAAKEISRILVKEKLAACSNIISNLTSIYEWKGKISEDSEYLIVLKSRRELFEKIQHKILKLHPYEVPEIISIKLDNGVPEYLKWISSCTINKEGG